MVSPPAHRPVSTGPRLIHGFAVLALIAAVSRLGGRLAFWLLPYDRLGAANEVALAAIGAIVGCSVGRLRRRALDGIFAGVGVYFLLSLAGVAWSPRDGLGVDRHRSWTFSSPACEFVARFPRPGTTGVLARQSDRDKPFGRYATLGDVETASSLRADCVEVPPGGAEAAARSALDAWLEGAKIGDVRRDEAAGPPLVLKAEGWQAESLLIDDAGRPRRALAVARVYVGERSILVVTAVQPVGDAPTPATLAFVGGAERK